MLSSQPSPFMSVVILAQAAFMGLLAMLGLVEVEWTGAEEPHTSSGWGGTVITPRPTCTNACSCGKAGVKSMTQAVLFHVAVHRQLSCAYHLNTSVHACMHLAQTMLFGPVQVPSRGCMHACEHSLGSLCELSAHTRANPPCVLCRSPLQALAWTFIRKPGLQHKLAIMQKLTIPYLALQDAHRLLKQLPAGEYGAGGRSWAAVGTTR